MKTLVRVVLLLLVFAAVSSNAGVRASSPLNRDLPPKCDPNNPGLPCIPDFQWR